MVWAGFLSFFSLHFHIKMTLKLESRVCPDAYKTSPMATKSSFSVFKIYNCFKKLSRKTCFFGTSIRTAFLLNFGGILGPKTWIFVFFSYFLLLKFEAFFGRRNKLEKIAFFSILAGRRARIGGVSGPLGRDLEMGLRTSELRLMRLAKLVTSYMIRL